MRRARLEQPANVDVARLLGIFNLLEAEILELDPQKKLSRLRAGEFIWQGRTFRAGSAATACGCASGRTSSPPVPATARSASTRWRRSFCASSKCRTRCVWSFSGGIRVDLARAEFEKREEDNKQWVVGFPQQTLRAL